MKGVSSLLCELEVGLDPSMIHNWGKGKSLCKPGFGQNNTDTSLFDRNLVEAPQIHPYS